MKFTIQHFAMLTCMLLCMQNLFAQVKLKPSIGLANKPFDGDSICPMVMNIDTVYNYESTGLKTGDTIPHFALYTVDDERIDIARLMESGKPTLLIGGSYTCPIFRQKREGINQLQTIYGDRVNIFAVYTEEAHPAGPDLSPYSGTVWTMDVNIKKNILYLQPRTYGDRKKAAREMLAWRELKVPLLLDGPCNAWWTTFGIAPNSAFLIAPDGVIVRRQGWLNSGDASMSWYIDQLLAGNKYPAVKENEGIVSLVQTADSVRFVFRDGVSNAIISIFDRYGRDPHGSVTFSGMEYAMSTRKFSSGLFRYEIRMGTELLLGNFTVEKTGRIAE